MRIHFVCQGNTYRSRLAEAYFNSKVIKNDKATSSGVFASRNLNGPITCLAFLLLKKAGINSFLSNESWVQTSKELLEKNDLIVFMDEVSFEIVKKDFGYHSANYEIWNIPDINEFNFDNETEVLNVLRRGKETFETIKKKVDLLISKNNLL